jgi:hypothetical protein
MLEYIEYIKHTIAHILSGNTPYNPAAQSSEEESLITLAFCELFVANCLDVCENPEAGKPTYTYKLKGNVDISLLNEVEQCVAKYLKTYQDYRSLLFVATEGLKEYKRAFPDKEIFDRDALAPHELTGRYQKIISDALLYNPPDTSC